MATFLIETQHTARECVWAVRQVLHQGPQSLEQYEWGCKDGVHVGWSTVDATTKFEVLATIPRALQPQTRIVQLNRFTADEVMAYHEGQMSAPAESAATR